MAILADRNARAEYDRFEGARMGDKDEKANAARLQRQRALGAQLRETFEKVSDEEVPERLRKLADDLDKQLEDRKRQSRDRKD